VRLDRIVAMTAVAKFLWGIPDRGLARRLYRIKAPTLVAWGDLDRLVPPQLADRFAAGIRTAEVARLAGCGHSVLFEQPAECAALVSSFLARSLAQEGATQ
jgi:pimeloyl-ACP methyl ester carboxylesterase